MRSTFAALAFSALALAGCHRNQNYAATPLLGSPVRIVIGRAYSEKERLYVEAQVTNVSDRPMLVDRNGVELALDNGEVLGRSIGITSTKQPYTIEPGRTRPVHVDFRTSDVKWRNVKHAKLEWSNAVSIDGRQVLIPPMDLEARNGKRSDDD